MTMPTNGVKSSEQKKSPQNPIFLLAPKRPISRLNMTQYTVIIMRHLLKHKSYRLSDYFMALIYLIV
ncbi:MAG: hypothetical protein HW390_2455 [Candidatus Brocadiaceae bacterium]|nr:hypothetical protein [Candidatus Brocadiaceae bacterium]